MPIETRCERLDMRGFRLYLARIIVMAFQLAVFRLRMIDAFNNSEACEMSRQSAGAD